MHAQPAWPAAPSRGPRALRAVLCVAVVLLAHAVVWLAVSTPPELPPAVRASAVQVRQVRVRQELVREVPMREVRDRDVREPQPDTVPARTAAAPVVPGAERAAARAPAPARRTIGDARAGAAARQAAHSARETGSPVSPAVAPRAPAASAVSAALPPSMTLPTYPTRIPPSASLTYAVRRGDATGEASLLWQVEGERYRLQLRCAMSSGHPTDRHSQGGFDAAGLAPLRLADRRRGRDVQAANFQRERGLITFSGPRWEYPLPAGAQDRLSWLVQLVAIASTPDALHEGATLSMWVVGTRGALSAWRFEVRGLQREGASSAWWLVREPEHPYDLRMEVWLDPDRGHWPVRLRQTQVPGGEPLEWLLRDAPQPARMPAPVAPT